MVRVQVARVELDDSNAGRSDLTGLVTAGIWLRTGTSYFPAQGWDDFAVVILAAWTDASLRLLRGERATARVDFMDGPFSVRIAPVAPNEWRLVLVEKRQSGQLEQVVTVDTVRLVESLIETSARLVETCQKCGWESADSARLVALSATLRGRMEKPRLE